MAEVCCKRTHQKCSLMTSIKTALRAQELEKHQSQTAFQIKIWFEFESQTAFQIQTIFYAMAPDQKNPRSAFFGFQIKLRLGVKKEWESDSRPLAKILDLRLHQSSLAFRADVQPCHVICGDEVDAISWHH